MKEKLRDFFHIVGLDIRRWDDLSVFSRQLIHILKYLDINLVLDVGAHEGQYAQMLFRTGYAGEIISFEPLSSAYKTLFKVSDGRRWRTKNMALGEIEDKVLLNVAGGNSSSSSLLKMAQAHLDAAPHTATVRGEMVEIKRLDTIVDVRGTSNFLKIDTQGYEMKVLEGATGIIDRIKGVQVEMSTEELYEGQALDYEISEWLIHRGFQLWALNPFLYNPKSGKLLQYDAIFVRGESNANSTNAKA